jgi:hypothetical protein
MTSRITDGGDIRCTECGREVDEFMTIAEGWGYWSDGCGDLLAYCPTCTRREFAPDAPASGRWPLVHVAARLECSVGRS